MHSELFVSRRGGQTWAVLVEDGAAVEVRVEEDDRGAPVGCIVKARVTSVLPGIQSAFMDTGMSREGFLHASDLLLPDDPREVAFDEDGDEESDDEDSVVAVRRSKATRGSIDRHLAPGAELLVQISRDAMESKGARVTCHVTLPGRYLVYLANVHHRGVSRRIADDAERERLRAILDRLPAGDGGFIVRTAGQGVEESALRADAELLLETWREIARRASRACAPEVVHRDADLLLRLLRDLPRRGVERIVVDDPGLHERALAYLSRVDAALAPRVTLHAGAELLFEAHGLDQEVERAVRPKVWLESGGHLVIESTEALVSIDVNSGRYTGGRDAGETILHTNLEAAREIARQLRLRDLGGIIVVDFIDMTRPEHRRRVIDELQHSLRRDRARTRVVGLSELGLLQLTRKRTGPGLTAQLTRRCPACSGQGRLKSPETVSAEALAELERLSALLDGQTVTVRAHPDVARAVRLRLQDPAAWAERRTEVRVEDDATLQPDRFDVLAW